MEANSISALGPDIEWKCILLIALTAGTLAQKDTNVCVDFKPTQNGPKKPVLPTVYSVAVECNILNKNFTTNYHEWFDYNNSRAAVDEHDSGARESAIYNFITNELITVDRKTKKCNVDSLSTDPNRQLFGYATSDGKAHIYTAGGALDFGRNFSEQWINQTTIRGIQCNLWRSCVYWDSINATMVVDWYFSVSSWMTSTMMNNAPVRAHVKGRVWQFGTPRDFEHIYEFTEFRNSIDRLTVFETREGVFCPGRKLTKPLPIPADYFHFQSEIIQSDVNLIGHIKEYFDKNTSLVRYDYTPMGPNTYGPDPQIQVHDFNTVIGLEHW
ncbi:hypothetical protein CHS0354_003418 [Potamilus streckersoni]|uniref:LolA-like domain-containing protein n=1 Tax=Potamilus streckersoni TaxID=2493646 RepID=A0AAE0VZD0_9BIVA|nr:hypothetical protein CHS0354_003418 [Potamilus streckersoni]